MRAANFMFVVIFLVWLEASSCVAQQIRHDRIFIVPAPKRVVIDGDLSDWDLSGAITCAFDEALKPRFTVTVAAMFDARALYIAAHFVDDTPMLNHHDPAVEPDRGWDGDCLQVRLCSDPKAPYPLPNMESERVCHLTMWFYTDQQLPALHIAYGRYRTAKIWTGKDSGLAFRRDKDGKGYTLEAHIPWERLNAKSNPPKAGDRIAFVVQPLWSDSTGWKQVLTFNDVIRAAGFSFQNASMWGQAIFLPHGKLKLAERPKPKAEETLPFTLRLPLPDARAKFVSAAIFNADGLLVRTLPVVVRDERSIGRGEKFVPIRWDGLDDDGQPLPPGRYTVKLLTHRGIGQRYITSLHNAGNPPWRTDDGTGSWGGDHGPPIAATADSERVYLAWTISEAGWAIIAVDPKLPQTDGIATRIGKKFWGQHLVGELGFFLTALASDGERLFVAQDGKSYGGDPADPKVLNKAGVVLWDTQTGKPINFPFGKRTLILSEWSDALKPPELQPYERLSVFHPLIPRKRFWERLGEGDFGPQELGLNLLGIAVSGDVLYGSLFWEDKIVAVNWRTGERLREFTVPKPCGLVVTKDGQLVAISGKRLVRLNPQTGELVVLAEGLSAPWGVALDERGNIYVTDCGKAMQVKVFDSKGKFLRAIGKEGGRPWVGRYEPNGLLRPSGITVDREGKVWVCEHDDAPRRVSVWTRDGKLVADLLGAGHYAVMGAADETNPRWVNTHATLFEVDYLTGKWQVLATLVRPQMHGFTFTPDGFTDRDYKFRHVRGQTFLVHCGRGGIVIYRMGSDFVAQPVCALGPGGSLWLHGFTKDDVPVPKKLREEFWRNSNAFAFWWTDFNGDGLVQPEEFVLERVERYWGLYWGSWVDDDLTIWSATPHGTGAIWRIPVKEWLPNGIPVYPKPSEQKPLMFVSGKGVIHSVMVDGDKLFVLEQEGGDAYGNRAKWSAVSCYQIPPSPSEPSIGKRLWAYRRTWLGFGLEAPLSKPGDVVGAMKFVGKAKLQSGITFIGVNGYFGQFNLLTDSGLWVASLCKDNRYGPRADETTVWPENFSGFLFRSREDGKVYLIAGDTDCRLWEVTGLESIRTAQTEFVMTDSDRQLAIKAAAARQGIAVELPPIRLRKVAAGQIVVDGDLKEWDMSVAVTIDAGAGRRAKAALAYDETNLYVAFDVVDDSPMLNSGKDFALLFKTGDACDLYLATDPSADPKRPRPVAGDVRLLFSVMDNQPVCVLYEPVARDGKRAMRLFTSPTGAEVFDKVVLLKEARVAIKRTQNGYVLEASVPLSTLHLSPKPGATYRGDVGVIYSDAGGSRNVLRACYFNKETAIVNDIPTEARLQPQNWGLVVVE